jgi:hypothetical protein
MKVVNKNECSVYGTRAIVNGKMCRVHGRQSIVNGRGCMVYAEYATVNGSRCTIRGRFALVTGKHAIFLTREAWDTALERGKHASLVVNGMCLARVESDNEEAEEEEQDSGTTAATEPSLSSRGLCALCMTDDSCVLLLPCKHVCMCENCYSRMTTEQCPICRQQFDVATKVFIT